MPAVLEVEEFLHPHHLAPQIPVVRAEDEDDDDEEDDDSSSDDQDDSNDMDDDLDLAPPAVEPLEQIDDFDEDDFDDDFDDDFEEELEEDEEEFAVPDEVELDDFDEA